MTTASALGSSFRDPAGFVFKEEGLVKRVVTHHGKQDYEKLLSSGLYEELVQNQWLVAHDEAPSFEANVYKIIVPEQLAIITYPYEWCFSQLKDAAILTLQIQLLALQHGMSLKDTNPFNIQWRGPSPVLVDTLSFEEQKERPWFAYRQFCEMFLAPLVMMAHVKPDFNKYLSVDLGGMNLSWCSQSLPFHTRLQFGYLVHIHLHALSQEKFANRMNGSPVGKTTASIKFSKNSMISLVKSLLSFVTSLQLKKRKTTFGDYYAECEHYSNAAEESKRSQIEAWIRGLGPSLVLDLGGNNGKFSRIITRQAISCICVDSDPYCVEENYLITKRENDRWMLPLVVDLTNPPRDLGWDGNERTAFFKRVKPDLVMALALLHHLRVTAGISMKFLANFFSKLAPNLILEFVPKEDPMCQKLLANRDDIFHDYNEQSFEAAFGEFNKILHKSRIPETQRILYCLRRK